MKFILAGILVSSALAYPQSLVIPNEISMRTIFIDQMPNALDSFIRAEFVKQMKGEITVVTRKADADVVVTETKDEQLLMTFRDGRQKHTIVPTQTRPIEDEPRLAAEFVRKIKNMRDRAALLAEFAASSRIQNTVAPDSTLR